MAPIIPFIIPVITAVSAVVGIVAGGRGPGGSSGQSMQQKAVAEIYEDQAEAMVESSYDQQARADEAELLAYQNAANTEAETYESARRAERENMEIESSQRARAAASGVLASENSSTGMFLEDQVMENSKQVDWLVQAGLSKADIERWQGGMVKQAGYDEAKHTRQMAGITKKRGDAAKIQSKASNTAGIIGGVGTLAGLGVGLYDDWGSGKSSDLSKVFS